MMRPPALDMYLSSSGLVPAPSETGGAVPARAGSGGHTGDKGATPEVDGGSGGEVVSATSPDCQTFGLVI